MIPLIQPAPEAEMEAIHLATLETLERVGVVFPSADARRVLREVGARVDDGSGVVRFPPQVVEEAVRRAPGDVLLAGRDPARDVRLDGGPTLLSLDGTGAYTLDHRSGARRSSTVQDLADACLVADSRPEIGVVWNIVSTVDTPANVRVLTELEACLLHTGKHVQGEVQRVDEVPYVMEMLDAATAGGWRAERPVFSIVYCPVAPLQHEPDMLAAAVALAREGVPMCIYSMGLMGATVPVALAGAVMQCNAEILSSLVLFQALRPGLPCVYVADTGVMDMHLGLYTAAAPEAVLLTQALVGLARRYGLPVMASGLTGDAKRFGHQSGAEAAFGCLASMLMRPDLLVGAGMHDGAQMMSLPKILLDCEVFRQCRRVVDGMTVDDESLMTDVVAEVGPGGHFLKARATREVLRRGELYRGEFFSHDPYEVWSAAPRDEVDAAVDEVERLLATHRPAPLPDGAAEHIADVLTRAATQLDAR